MANRKKIYITRKIPQPGIDLLSKYFILEIYDKDHPIKKYELKKALKDKAGLISLLTDEIVKEVIDNAPLLEIIANYAAGYNNIDVVEATKRGIMVTNTPDVLTETTADLAFGMLIAIARRIPEAERFIRKGKFKGWAPMLFLGNDVHHKKIGIIGMGRIGRAVARRALGFGMEILYYDKNRLPIKQEKDLFLNYKPFDYILKNADFITIHTPLTRETYHLISHREFNLMKKTAFLINTARGQIVDEMALIEALKKKKLAGCALDVFENEPRLSKELLSMDNVLILPHIGSATLETRTNMALMCAKNVITALIEHKTPPNLINPEVLKNKI